MYHGGDAEYREGELMTAAVKVTILRWVSDDPQPGVVECELVDVHGRHWLFLLKSAIVSAEDLTSRSAYPRPASLDCTIVRRSCDAAGRPVVTIDTSAPLDEESIDGQSQFEVAPDSLTVRS